MSLSCRDQLITGSKGIDIRGKGFSPCASCGRTCLGLLCIRGMSVLGSVRRN